MTVAEAPAHKSIVNLKTARELDSKFKEYEQARGMREQQWRMDLAWYKGRQYTYKARQTNRLEALPVEDGDKPAYIVRLVANMILPNVQSLVSRMTKTKPRMNCVPGSGDDQALKAAQMADAVLQSSWRDFEMDDKLLEVLHWATICSQGYMKFSWDKQAGRPMTFLLDPQGQPVVQESLKVLYEQNLRTRGIDPRDPRVSKTVYMGDIKVETLSPFEVFPDPSANTFSDAKWAICKHAMDPDEIKARWGKDVTPDSMPSSPDMTIGSSGPLAPVKKNSATLKTVYFLYVRPNPTCPKGRYAVWVAGGDDLILEDIDWPYPFRTLPIVKFGGLRIPGDVYDSSVVEHAIPLQKELNRTISQIVEYKNLTVRPQLLAPVGSLRQRLTNEPGRVNEYMPIAGFKPEPLDYGNLPAYIFNHLENIKARLDEVFFNNEISQGGVPPNVEAGTAIDLLQEMSTDRLAPWILLMERSIEQAGQIILCLAQQYYSEPRLLKLRGGGSGMQVKQFTSADITGDITVHVETASGLPRTRAGKQAMIMQLIQLRVIPPDKAYKFFENGDLEALGAQMAADEDQAQREHDKILRGDILNPLAMQDAQQALMKSNGVNPQTGQPFNGPDEIQQFLEQAAFSPTDFEDWASHLDTHAIYMKSPDYEALPPDVQKLFLIHFNATRDRYMNLPRVPTDVKSPNINLQIKSTAGPTATAEILNAGGVFRVTPDQLTEPPLETWISDDPSKDQGFAASNNPESMMHLQELQQAQQMEHDQAQHDQQMEMQLAAHHQKMQQTAEAHSVKQQNAKAAKPSGSK